MSERSIEIESKLQNVLSGIEPKNNQVRLNKLV